MLTLLHLLAADHEQLLADAVAHRRSARITEPEFYELIARSRTLGERLADIVGRHEADPGPAPIGMGQEFAGAAVATRITRLGMETTVAIAEAARASGIMPATEAMTEHLAETRQLTAHLVEHEQRCLQRLDAWHGLGPWPAPLELDDHDAAAAAD